MKYLIKLKENMRQSWDHRHVFSTTDYIICSHTQHFIDKEEEKQIITGDI